MKRAHLKNAAFIDFHICQGAIGLSLDEIRDEENGDVISRPWMMWTREQKEEAVETVTDYEKEVVPILRFIKCFSRSNIKGLLSAAKEDIVSLQMEISRMYGHADKDAKEKCKGDFDYLKSKLSSEESRQQTRGIVYDLALAYDLWFDKQEV